MNKEICHAYVKLYMTFRHGCSKCIISLNHSTCKKHLDIKCIHSMQKEIPNMTNYDHPHISLTPKF